MAAIGTVGARASVPFRFLTRTLGGRPWVIRAGDAVLGSVALYPPGPTDTQALGYGLRPPGRQNDVGSPPPSLLERGRSIGPMLFPVPNPGDYTVTIACRYWPAADPPRLRIKPALDLGIWALHEATAPAGTDFVTITLPVTIRGTGVLAVERVIASPREDAYVFWDNARLT